MTIGEFQGLAKALTGSAENHGTKGKISQETNGTPKTPVVISGDKNPSVTDYHYILVNGSLKREFR